MSPAAIQTIFQKHYTIVLIILQTLMHHGFMAVQGRIAFSDEDHAELLRLAPYLSDIELAAKFRVSLPTVTKYKKMPIGSPRKTLGRPKKEKAGVTSSGTNCEATSGPVNCTSRDDTTNGFHDTSTGSNMKKTTITEVSQ